MSQTAEQQSQEVLAEEIRAMEAGMAEETASQEAAFAAENPKQDQDTPEKPEAEQQESPTAEDLARKMAEAGEEKPVVDPKDPSVDEVMKELGLSEDMREKAADILTRKAQGMYTKSYTKTRAKLEDQVQNFLNAKKADELSFPGRQPEKVEPLTDDQILSKARESGLIDEDADPSQIKSILKLVEMKTNSAIAPERNRMAEWDALKQADQERKMWGELVQKCGTDFEKPHFKITPEIYQQAQTMQQTDPRCKGLTVADIVYLSNKQAIDKCEFDRAVDERAAKVAERAVKEALAAEEHPGGTSTPSHKTRETKKVDLEKLYAENPEKYFELFEKNHGEDPNPKLP